jgi:hypothetical protein
MKAIFNFFILFALIFNLTGQTIISGGEENDIIGRICRLSDTKLLAIIERNPDWVSGDLYVTFSVDNGSSWGELQPVVVKQGNQSTHSVVVTQDDSIRVYYASDETGPYKIRTISSFDGINWMSDHQLNLGWTSESVYDPHVLVEEGGSMTMTYVRLGGGGFVTHCSEINQWDQNKTLIQPEAYRIRICKHPVHGYLAAYHRNMGSNQYDVNVKTSTDLINWSNETNLTSSGNSHDPFCGYMDLEYWVYYATYKNGAYNLYRKSSPNGLSWSAEEQITFDNTHNTQPAFMVDYYLKTNVLNLVWTHAINYDTDNDIYFQSYLYTASKENRNQKGEFKVLQNSEHSFQLIMPDDLTGEAVLTVYNLQGQIIESKKLTITENLSQLDLKLRGAGVYLFKLNCEGEKFTTKIYSQ